MEEFQFLVLFVPNDYVPWPFQHHFEKSLAVDSGSHPYASSIAFHNSDCTETIQTTLITYGPMKCMLRVETSRGCFHPGSKSLCTPIFNLLANPYFLQILMRSLSTVQTLISATLLFLITRKCTFPLRYNR